MRKITCLVILVFAASTLFAQKDTLTNKKNTANNRVVATTNPKLLSMQATVKSMQVKLEELKALAKNLKDTKDSISSMSEEDMMWMQKFMEQKAQLEQMISNTMKACSESASSISHNLKAS